MSRIAKPVLGWREWAGLPELGIEQIKCKVDTGARTSALHAFDIEPDSRTGKVHFKIHPLQNRTDHELRCVAAIQDARLVTDSGGHRERRYVIRTSLAIGADVWPIEVTLTNRKSMRFRMLLGRSAVQKRYLVDSGRSYLIGKRQRKQ